MGIGQWSEAENWNLEVVWVDLQPETEDLQFRGLRFSFLVVQSDLQIGFEQVAWLHGAIENSN